MRRWFALLLVACSPPAKHRHEHPVATAAPTRASIYETIAKTTSSLDGFARSAYGATGIAALDKLHTRKGFDALIVDPAIVIAIDDFMREAGGADPWAARAKFLAAGGTKRVYRGLAVSEIVADDLKKHGMLSKELRGGQNARPVNLVEEAALHVVAEAGGGDSLISVSTDPAIAKCIAHQLVGDDRSVVVYAIDVPAREVIHLDPGSPMCGAVPAAASLDCTSLTPPFAPELRPYLCAALSDASIESFVVDQIDPPEIVSSEAPTDFADCDEVLRKVGDGFSAHLEAARALCR